MNLILLESREIDAEGRTVLRDARAEHIRRVLRAEPGQRLRLGLLDGPLGLGTVESMTAGGVTLACQFDSEPPPISCVDLLLALPRPKVLKRLWSALGALGVRHILLTNADKVERMYFDTHVLDPACYRPLLIEGLQQARDTRLPTVSLHRRLKVLLEDELEALCPGTERLFGDPASSVRMVEALAPARPDRVLLAVGPEGGWTPYEERLLAAHGFRPVGLGPRILRTDTACIALLALLNDHLASQPRAGRTEG